MNKLSAQPAFAVLFDMDGVLMDTVPASIHARKVMASKYGFTPEEMMQHSKPGRSLRDFYRTLQEVRPFEVDFDTFADAMLQEVFTYLEKNKQPTDPQLLHFLADLKNHHIPVAVGTSALKRSTMHKLTVANLHTVFDKIVTADDVDRHKPHPDIYQEAAKQLRVQPSHCIVIEDAVDGIEAGKAAGMKAIGFSKYASDISKLQKADIIVDGFSKLNYQILLQLVNN